MIIVTQNTIPNNELIIDKLIDKISLSKSLYEKINTRYENIGKWLDREESLVKDFNPKIYAQGSIRTGTAIQPLTNGCYDVDLVCQLDIDHTTKSPKEIKSLIGKEIERYMKEYGMLAEIEESKRCWTVNYADEVAFHVDILPCIFDKFNEAQVIKWIDTAIMITDKTFNGHNNIPGEWAYSNPIGYSKWLEEVEITIFNKKKEELKKSLEPIHEYSIITPLRRAIMLLKRHRDVFFENKAHIKPPSVLITTLAGLAYYGSNIEDTWSTIQHIVNNMENKIIHNETEFTVLNPANNKENFTDKWTNNKELKENFYLWLNQLKQDSKFLSDFEKSVSTNTIKNCFIKSVKDHLQNILNQPHRSNVNLNANSNYQCNISKAFVTRNGFRKNKSSYKNGDFFPNGCAIDFEATTTVPQPYSVSWQVTNTGEEAKNDNNLRGVFFKDENSKVKLEHREYAKYRGVHSIECLISKDSIVVAKSKPFIVIIN